MIKSFPFELAQFSEIQQFLGDMRREANRCHVLHPGDVTWQVFHMRAAHDPANLLRLWRDEAAVLAGFWLVHPDFGMFDLQLHPKFRDADREAELLKGVQAYITSLNPTVSRFSTLVNEHDTVRKSQLEAAGFTPQGDWLYTQHPLTSIPEIPLAPDFTLTDMTQVDAERRAKALADAFGGIPNTGHYQNLMSAPGYDPELDLVALAPDGQVAAFALGWLDPVSGTGQFEPVGTVEQFRGRGLGKVLLTEGLRRLKQRGMQTTIVIVEAAEEPAVALYTSVGFVPQWRVGLYAKQAE